MTDGDNSQAEYIRCNGAHWNFEVMMGCYLERDDKRRLVCTLFWNTEKQQYMATAVETGADQAVAAVLDDHGHVDLGAHESEVDAKRACTEFGAHWLETGKSAEACDCEEIEGAWQQQQQRS